ncbi:hypothetical protein QA447_05550 [Pseudomonas sp. abacavir_1]
MRTDIERALDELASQEEGMRFQGLAVVLGKKRWPELIARQRKKDLGLDAYAPSSLATDSIGKGLAASITPTLKKISDDAKTAKENFPDLRKLLFVTSAKVGNADRKRWEEAIRKDYDVELHILEREEIITQMMMPENASLRASFLHLDTNPEPLIADLIERTRRAAVVVTRVWEAKTKGHPLIELNTVQLDPDGAEAANVLSLEQIDEALLQSGRIVLEGPAGRGKTTLLIQLAQRPRTSGTPFIVDLPSWTSSRRGILEHIAGMPAFQAEGLTATDLARVQQAEPFLFLLNGWNEIAESNSAQSNDALRELERDFPSAGIIVATRTHHLTPPLPGALRLRLLRLQRGQRAAYLTARLGANAAELCSLIDGDPSLDELTCTPFILSEVSSLFEAGAEIPSTKIGILAQVLHLQEQRNEHRNALRTAPIFDEQTEYLKTLAIEMTRRGTVVLPEADARTLVAAAARELVNRGQIEPVGAPVVLATLTAHHVLERVDYPQTAFQFEHQQLQEYYAAIDLRGLLFGLRGDNHNAISNFTATYVNDPAWAEPLRMIAETFAEQSGNVDTVRKNTCAGEMLVRMALTVDPVFAGELAQLCGTAVWNAVRVAVGEHIRSVYAIRDGSFRQYSIAAMLATGSDDFIDVIAPLLSGEDQQTRLAAYRLWPNFLVSSLGPNWREHVRGWGDEARADFVSELLHHRTDSEIAAFAAEDKSTEVKRAAVSGLIWTGSDDALTLVLESMDEQTFEEVACQYADRMPVALRPKTIAAMRKFVTSTQDHPARLRTALDLNDFGESGIDETIKDALLALSGDMRNLGPHYIKPALEHLRKTDPTWVSEWVAIKIAEGALFEHEYWLQFATVIPDSLVEKCLQRLETESLKNERFDGMVSIIAASADTNLAARVFAKLRELSRKVDEEPGQQHEFEWQTMRQLEAVFRHLPDNIRATGILSSVSSGNPLDIKVAADLLSRVARLDAEPLRISDDDVREHLRSYLKSGADVVLRQDDFIGKEKANLASAISQVGKLEDMTDLVRLIHADIERIRRGRAAHAAGDRGLLGNGGSMSYAKWHIAAIMLLDSTGAPQALIHLLAEPEYRSEVAAAMACDFLPKPAHSFYQGLRYDLMWAAREGRVPPNGNDHRRERFAAALDAEIRRLLKQNKDGKHTSELKELATALAAVDGRGSRELVLDVIAKPSRWQQYLSVGAAERLLIAGTVLPAAAAFALVDSVLECTENWMQESDRHILSRILVLCAFVDDPAAGIAKIRDVLGMRRLRGYELRMLVTALGESRSDAAVDLLYELASDALTLEHCEDNFINAFAALNTPRARELLLGFVDPYVSGVASTGRPHFDDVLVVRLAEQAQYNPEVSARLRVLCEFDLPERNRNVISKVMNLLGTPEALIANLNLIDDAKPSPVPQGIWEQLEGAFVERRPNGQIRNVFTRHARASNELRVRLFRMAIGDERRQKTASMLLGQIEEWRLEHGRPTDEPRHPDLASGQSWPPKDI